MDMSNVDMIRDIIRERFAMTFMVQRISLVGQNLELSRKTVVIISTVSNTSLSIVDTKLVGDGNGIINSGSQLDARGEFHM